MSQVLRAWPEHEPYLDLRFGGADARERARSAYLAERIDAIIAPDPAARRPTTAGPAR
ncbi:hypothetical protein NKH77_44460 [Streptomyces sp. M19]